MWKTVPQSHFVSFLDPPLIAALNPSFYGVLAFASDFIPVENYLVNICLSEANYLKAIL